MTTRRYLDYRSEEVRSMLARTFPEYHGHKVTLEQRDAYTPDNYWTEGSRTYYRLVRLADLAVIDGPTNNPFEQRTPALFSVPDGVAVVEHSIFCGKDLGIRVLVNGNTFPQYLPEPGAPPPPELHPVEASWLDALAGLTSAGRKDAIARYGIPQRVVDRAVDRLVEFGYATRNKAGAVTITQAGRERRDCGLPNKLDFYGMGWDTRKAWAPLMQSYLAS